MKIVFWENIVSQHKLPYWNFLANSDKVQAFTLVVEQELGDDLKIQGWESDWTKSPRINLICNPLKTKLIEIFDNSNQNTYHVFSGIRANPMVFNAFKTSLNYQVNRILLTETINLNGIRKITRRLFACFNERKYGNYFDLVLGSGTTTQSWYLENGIQKIHFYPFLYCVNTPLLTNDIPSKSNTIQLVFIGQIIERKGLDILLKALNQLKNDNWHLTIYGAGNDLNKHLDWVNKNNLETKITFKGTISNSALRKEIASYDLLVLPSRFDGWGAVINEAIASGVRTICSDRCGASILLVNDTIGNVFRSTNANELATLLKEHINLGANQNRSEILKYSNYLTGEAVANYLLEIIEFHYNKIGDRPLPPWEKYLREFKQKSL